MHYSSQIRKNSSSSLSLTLIPWMSSKKFPTLYMLILFIKNIISMNNIFNISLIMKSILKLERDLKVYFTTFIQSTITLILIC